MFALFARVGPPKSISWVWQQWFVYIFLNTLKAYWIEG